MKTSTDHKVPCHYCSKISLTDCLHLTNCVFGSWRDASNLASTRNVVTPATRFTATSSYRVLVRMPNFPEKILGQDAVLAGTYGEGNETRDHGSQNQKQQDILK